MHTYRSKILLDCFTKQRVVESAIIRGNCPGLIEAILMARPDLALMGIIRGNCPGLIEASTSDSLKGDPKTIIRGNCPGLIEARRQYVILRGA